MKSAQAGGIHTLSASDKPFSMLFAVPVGGDMQWVLARRYRIPVASVRDAFYDIMLDDNAIKAALGVTK
jgi:hypothetical protein